jgi:hypothetical protein
MIVLVMRLIGPSQKKVLNGHMAEVLTSRPAGLGSMLISDENPIFQVPYCMYLAATDFGAPNGGSGMWRVTVQPWQQPI